jgi:hypothetical protein
MSHDGVYSVGTKVNSASASDIVVHSDNSEHSCKLYMFLIVIYYFCFNVY